MTHSKKISVPGMIQAGVALIIVIIIGILCLIVSSDDYKQNKAKQQAIQQERIERIARQPVKVYRGTVGDMEVYIEEFEPLRK